MRYVLALTVLLGSSLAAQTPPAFSVPGFPASFVLSWDDPTAPPQRPTEQYRVLVDATPAVTVTAPATPCTACVSLPFTITVAGTHTVSVAALNHDANGNLQQTVAPLYTFTVTHAANTSPSPVVIHLSLAPAANPGITDGRGNVWTVVSGTVYQNERDRGAGSELVLAANGRIYKFVPTSGQWYEDHDPDWWTWGPTRPQ